MVAEAKFNKRKGSSNFSKGGGKSSKDFNNKKPKIDPNASSTSQKRALKHERQSHRKHAEAVTTAKDLWNKLRLKNNTPDDIRKHMVELMDLIRGKVNEIALQHDASRVVQAAIQFGNEKERKEVVTELCTTSNLAELSKVQYSHFVVLKAIKYCSRDDDLVKQIVKSLKGSIPKLAVHAVGARVVELLFSTFQPKQTMTLRQEFYGPHFALFSDVSVTNPTLAYNLEQSPEKKQVTLEFVVAILNKGIEKQLFGFVYFQQLFAEYVDIADANDVRSMASNVADHSIHMLSTRAGTRVVAACAAYGTAKDRKRIMKSLKGYTRSSLMHRDAYLAILRLVQVTDDTVSVQKSVLAELLTLPDEQQKAEDSASTSPLLDVAMDEAGSKLFLMLLVANEESRLKYLDPYERKVLESNPTVVEDGKDVPTSKKNPETRRKELVQNLQKPLIEMCTNHADVLLQSIEGSRVLREVYTAFHSQDVMDSILEACEGSSQKEESENDEPMSLFEDQVGHLTIKNILLSDAEEEKSKESDSKTGNSFAKSFQERFAGKLSEVGKTNRGAFVLTALCKVPSIRSEVIKELKKDSAKIKKLSEGEKATAGFLALLQELAG